jgi:hypothetical protein
VARESRLGAVQECLPELQSLLAETMGDKMLLVRPCQTAPTVEPAARLIVIFPV